MTNPLPEWLNPDRWLPRVASADARAVQQALLAEEPGLAELAALLSPAAGAQLESLAGRAQLLTRRQFGRTMMLYAPLYLSDYCESGCVYCGFAANRRRKRRRLERGEIIEELDALHAMGFEEILLLTGARTRQADFNYVRKAAALAAERFNLVTIEVFPLTLAEYKELAETGCTGVTIYQETYDPTAYKRTHRWGIKRDYQYRLATPARALSAGMRSVGLGVLLGLADPVWDALALFQHVQALRKQYWRTGFSISFPRIQPQPGDYTAPYPVSDRFLAQLIYAFRICLPELTLVLSTREGSRFRDGLAGVGINKMSVASRTTVGGYHAIAAPEGQPSATAEEEQFRVSDNRTVEVFCAMLRSKGLEPVFKNWDATYRDRAGGA